MKRLNIHAAFIALDGSGTKEDIIIQMAKLQNIRFSELSELQKDVDVALDESKRLGFVEHKGPVYTLNFEPSKQSVKSIKKNLSVQGSCDDGCCSSHVPLRGSCLNSAGQEGDDNISERGKTSRYASVCNVCGLTSENRLVPDDQDVGDGNWQDMDI